MADALKFVQVQPFSLAGSGAPLGATSITLQTFTTIDGALLTITDFGTLGYATMEPGSGTQEEAITFSGVTQNANGTATLTGVKTQLFISPYTQTSGLAKSHAGGTSLIITNSAGFYNDLTGKDNDETITGTWTFTNPKYPRMDTATPFPTDNEQLATKAYADSLTFAGAPDASPTQKGISQESTQAQRDARTPTGSSGAPLFLDPVTQRAVLMHDYAVSATGNDSYAITLTPAVTAYTVGDIYIFKADVQNTTGATLAVNGLGAKPIVKDVSTTLSTGDILAGQIVTVVYDGTNMQLQSPIALPGGAASQTGVQNQSYSYAVDSVGTDSYAITLSPVVASYVAGQRFSFKAGTANTGPATLNVNAIGPISIKKNKSLDLQTGDIVSGQIIDVEYDGTNFQMQTPTASVGLASVARGVGSSNAAYAFTVPSDGTKRPIPVVNETFDALGELDMTNQAVTCAAGTGTTAIIADAAIFTADDVGRWFINTTRGLATKITVFNSTTNVTCSPAVAGQTTADTGFVYSGKFTAAATGYYQVNISMTFDGGVSAAVIGYMDKNGGAYSQSDHTAPASALRENIMLSDIIQLNAGETVQGMISTTAATVAFGANAAYPWISIKRLS